MLGVHPPAFVTNALSLAKVKAVMLSTWCGRQITWLKGHGLSFWRMVRPPIIDFVWKYPRECLVIVVTTCAVTGIVIKIFRDKPKKPD
jgi:hypothetical protein